MSLTISKFAPKFLHPKRLAHIRNHGELNQAQRLTVCRACGRAIVPGEMRLSGKFGYLNAQTGHIHQECPK